MLSTHLAARLEEGAWTGLPAVALARLWQAVAARRLARRVPETHARTLCIGGATLGGSGKTPLALACARHLVARGATVSLIGHAYRASPRVARVVRPEDPVREVGDEALMLACALAHEPRAEVVVAPSRAAAMARARGDVIIFDGLHQMHPDRADLALLAVDANHPWGAGRCPPAGDLRAGMANLQAAADVIVAVGTQTEMPNGAMSGARIENRGVWLPARQDRAHLASFGEGTLLPWASLRDARIGLYTGLARPARITTLLAHHGVRPCVVVRARDHGPPSRGAAAAWTRANVDVWLATAKCANQLVGLPYLSLRVIDMQVHLDPALRIHLDHLLQLQPRRRPALTTMSGGDTVRCLKKDA